jgi:hypothetical protein
VAVAVIMEHAGSGSDFATPAGQRVMAAALQTRHARESSRSITIPTVRCH